MLLTPPLYLPTPMLLLPQICMPTLDDRSRDRHILGVFHQLWTTQTAYYRKCSNSGTDPTKSPAPTSSQRWGSLLRNSRLRILVLVPVAISLGLGESSTWSTRSKANGDNRPCPLEHIPLASHSPNHTSTSSLASLPEVKDGSSLNSSSVYFPISPVPSLSVPEAFCFFFVYWLLMLPQMVVWYRCALMRIPLYIVSVCMQLVLLFNPFSFPPHAAGVKGYFGSFCHHQTCACMYHYKKSSNFSYGPGVPSCYHSLFICCRDRSFAPTCDHPWLSHFLSSRLWLAR